ncbi:MAG: hypothetical protein A4E27_00640 [Methanobacterium sp. PtaU1.Bin242]|nr:MAG: hypothetical protein A4E27_00640 [Methanobacterium sp. PtaU1.Bin242]
MTFTNELLSCQYNPIGMHTREICELYWDNYTYLMIKTWMKQLVEYA